MDDYPMTVPTEELQRLLDRSDSDKDHVRYDARDKLDAMAIDMARRVIAMDAVTASLTHGKYLAECACGEHDDEPPAGPKEWMQWADKADAALTAYDQACNQSAGEGDGPARDSAFRIR